MALPRHAASLALLVLLVGPAAGETADGLDAQLEELFGAMERATGALTDHTCTFTKREYVAGQMQATETMLLKQSRPLGCIYLKWIAEPRKGRETIYCPGRYDGKLQVHEGSGVASWVGTLSLDPLGAIAMKGHRHPVTEAGIFYTCDTICRSFENERHSRLGEVHLEDVDGEPSSCATLAPSESPAERYAAERVEICSHRTLHLPTRVRIWEPDGRLVEHYTYRDYRLNPGLTAKDFDTRNPDYGF